MVALTSRARQANICSILATKFNPGNFSQSTSFQLFEWSNFQRDSKIISDCSSSTTRDSVNTFIRLSSVRTATRPAVHSLWIWTFIISLVHRPEGNDRKATTTLIHRRIFQMVRDTWTGGDKRMAPRRLDKTVQSIILDKPAKQAIWTASSSPSINLRSSSDSAPNSTILPSRCTA